MCPIWPTQSAHHGHHQRLRRQLAVGGFGVDVCWLFQEEASDCVFGSCSLQKSFGAMNVWMNKRGRMDAWMDGDQMPYLARQIQTKGGHYLTSVSGGLYCNITPNRRGHERTVQPPNDQQRDTPSHSQSSGAQLAQPGEGPHHQKNKQICRGRSGSHRTDTMDRGRGEPIAVLATMSQPGCFLLHPPILNVIVKKNK